MSATPAPLPTVVRPTATSQRRTLLVSLIAVPIVLLSMLINRNLPAGVVIGFVALIAVAIVFTVVRMRRLRIEYGDGRYRYVSMYRTRDFGVADIRQVHTFTSLRQGMYTFPDLMVEGQDGRRLVRLPGMLWDVNLLAVLAQEFQSHGVPLVVAQTPVTAAEVRARFPKLVSWFEAHQLLAAALVGVGALIIGVLAIVITLAVLFAS